MAEVQEKVVCYHCGEECCDNSVAVNGRAFCCEGCKLVYEIIQENNLCSYYDLNKYPGLKQPALTGKRFSFLDEPAIMQKLISFQRDHEIHVFFHLPAMHCSSCIWLLENFKRVDPGIHSSRVNFLKREIQIIFDDRKTSLRKIVEALTQTGFEPDLCLDALEKNKLKKVGRDRLIRIGVAGFCFGNIMMLSFPEYFSSGKIIDPGLKEFFSLMNLLLALPVFIYSASEFFIRSFIAIKHKTSSIDIPIALGIAALFLRSAYEILTHTGSGYLDSGSGLIFFMLIGRWFQDFTFDSLAFDRDYTSYFPIAVTRIHNQFEKEVAVNELKINDRILIRNNEIIPVDAVLVKGNAEIDYHFVTGESVPVYHREGETVFAGGRQLGSMVELRVTREISSGYLTQLWNRNFSNGTVSRFEKTTNEISKWFVAGTLLIAFVAGAYWWSSDVHRAINAFTAVLVIACPCALALSAPFTYGNILRLLGRKKIFLRDYHVFEKLADVTAIVFDKTGTLTENNSTKVHFVGVPLSDEERKLIYSLVRQSSHPLSVLLRYELAGNEFYQVERLREEPGNGISGDVNGVLVKAGNEFFAGEKKLIMDTLRSTQVFVSLNGTCRGSFVFSNSYRAGVKQFVSQLLKKKYSLFVLTGDNESEKDNLSVLFGKEAIFRFRQSPEDKYKFILRLKKKKFKVLMIGDGLNDAGALLESDVGISVTDQAGSFTPASDGILHASQLERLPFLLAYSKSAIRIIIISFILSLVYNAAGLSMAVTGNLSPLFAAILMPISTISLVLFTVIAGTLKGKLFRFC